MPEAHLPLRAPMTQEPRTTVYALPFPAVTDYDPCGFTSLESHRINLYLFFLEVRDTFASEGTGTSAPERIQLASFLALFLLTVLKQGTILV